MNKAKWLGILSFAVILQCGSHAGFADMAATMPASTNTTATTQPLPPADMAAPKPWSHGLPNARFMKLHESFLARGKAGPIDLLFLGDSITEFWGTKGKAVWAKAYTKYNPANFGISGDQTQGVLWRIDHGELDGIHPKVLVLMIGTNNIPRYRQEDVATADEKIIAEIHQKLPDTRLLLLGIFPRGMDPKNAGIALMRDKIKWVNTQLAKLDDGSRTRYLDIGDKFLAPDGTIPKDIMPDALHPSAKGYQIWVDAMQPLLDEMWK